MLIGKLLEFLNPMIVIIWHDCDELRDGVGINAIVQELFMLKYFSIYRYTYYN